MQADDRLLKLAERIFAERIVCWGSFGDLKHHRGSKRAEQESPFYFDFRVKDAGGRKRSSLSSSTLSMITRCLLTETAGSLPVDYIAGVPTGGVSIAEAFHTHLAYICTSTAPPLVLVEKRKDDAGMWSYQKRPGKVILIDDVLTSGQSILEAITALEEKHYSVSSVAVVVDRAQGGARNIKKRHNCKVHSLFTAPWLFTHYYQQGWIDEERYDTAIEYIKENQLTL